MLPLIIVIGPTAVGKSALGIALAQRLNGEIISGDSVQVYRKLDIGSAKPSQAEQQNIPHHLLDFLDPTETFTVARFQELFKLKAEEIRSRGSVPILVGGTGLYIRSVLDDYAFPEQGSNAIKEKWQEVADKQGKHSLHQALHKCDPASAEKLHPNDVSRIIRALEVFELTGKPLSQQRSYQEREYPKLDQSIIYLGLTAPRELIYQRINKRCENMLEQGLIQEVASLLQLGYSSKLKGLQSIGYRHVIYYLHGIVTFEEMLRLFQRDTRHFAKRQLTWFRRDPRITWYDITTMKLSDIVDTISGTVSSTCRDF